MRNWKIFKLLFLFRTDLVKFTKECKNNYNLNYINLPKEVKKAMDLYEKGNFKLEEKQKIQQNCKRIKGKLLNYNGRNEKKNQ